MKTTTTTTKPPSKSRRNFRKRSSGLHDLQPGVRVRYPDTRWDFGTVVPARWASADAWARWAADGAGRSEDEFVGVLWDLPRRIAREGTDGEMRHALQLPQGREVDIICRDGRMLDFEDGTLVIEVVGFSTPTDLRVTLQQAGERLNTPVSDLPTDARQG